MERIEIAVVGAGVVGLAVAWELSKKYQNVFVLEKEASFGQGTSSRNSEVVHAGIYYPKDSLKAKTCVEGRTMLYEFCEDNGITFKITGKIIVATNKNEESDLVNLLRQGLANGAGWMRLLSRSEIKEMEPQVEAMSGLYSSFTGIVDSHGLMKTLAARLKSNKGDIVYNTEVLGIKKVEGGYEITVKDKSGECFKFWSRIFVNAAGLNSDKVAELVGLAKSEYKLNYSRGDYLRVCSNKAKLIKSRLIYPVPRKAGAGLGIHATLDLAGGLRLGPDDAYIEEVNYEPDISKVKVFYESVRSFLPFIELEDLTWDMAGVRPKLQGQGEPFRDFVIKNEIDDDFPGFINLIGIESPGLTSSLSIAKLVRKLVEETI